MSSVRRRPTADFDVTPSVGLATGTIIVNVSRRWTGASAAGGALL